MRSQLPENALVTLLRQCYLSPRCQSASGRMARPRSGHSRTLRTSSASRPPLSALTRGNICGPVWRAGDEARHHGVIPAQPSKNYSSSSAPTLRKSPKNIAVLGGGISGLASAYYLSKELPSANITLYEKTERLGGWIYSARMDVDNGTILFEQGPRSLRPSTPAGLVTLALIKELGLENQVIVTGKHSAASINRFIYYPDRLVRMPGLQSSLLENMWTILTDPIFEGWFTALMEYTRPTRPSGAEDESIGSWLNRRLGGPSIGDNIVSAIFHGIYAGDIYQLSMKALMPMLWDMEVAHGSLGNMVWTNLGRPTSSMQYRDAMLGQELRNKPQQLAMASKLNEMSVYSLKNGIGDLSDTIATELEGCAKVSIMTDTEVSKISFNDKTNSVEITTANNKPIVSYDQVISTMPSFHLARLCESKNSALASTHAVTVMVVNLYYPMPNMLPVAGFGYLIPRSVPFSENPERALGVVFDSDTVVGQDSVLGTKVTVMFGGHWWDDYLPSDYPTQDDGVKMAQAVLKRHLRLEAQPSRALAAVNFQCIPQYTVGHEQRMKEAHRWLSREFRGKMAVAGSSYTGVGINDCIRAARDTAHDVAHYEGPSGITGLEQFTIERRWVEALWVKKGHRKPQQEEAD